MPDETIAGLIPRISIQRPYGNKEYAVLVTDTRSIFVREVHSKTRIGLVSAETIGIPDSHAFSSHEPLDYDPADPDLLATDPKNFVILHEWLERIEIRKNMIGPLYKLNIEYLKQEGKGRKVKGTLSPPSEPSQRKQDSMIKKLACYDYARKAQEVYRNALPDRVSGTIAEWKL